MGYAQTQAHTQAQQPQGSQPGRPVHPQERNSAFSPIRLSTMPTPGDQTPPLHRGPSEKTLALSPGLPGLCPFSSPHRAPIHLFSYLNKRWDFFSFLCHHKEGGDANRQLNIHGARLPGTSVLRCCKKKRDFLRRRRLSHFPFQGAAGGHAAPGQGKAEGQGERQGPTHAHRALPSIAARLRPRLGTLRPRGLSEARPEAPTNGKGSPRLSSCCLGTTVPPGSARAADRRRSPKRAVDGGVRHILFLQVGTLLPPLAGAKASGRGAQGPASARPCPSPVPKPKQRQHRGFNPSAS